MSGIKKRSVSLSGHRTSYSIEDEFLSVIRDMASEAGVPLARMIASIDAARGSCANLSSALRLAALRHAQAKAARLTD